jgi:hypothetical protein
VSGGVMRAGEEDQSHVCDPRLEWSNQNFVGRASRSLDSWNRLD